MNIKNEETTALARELAAATGETLTRAVTVAIRERLVRVQQLDQAAVAERVERMRQIARDAAPRWIEPYRSSSHAKLLYDGAGLPR